MRNGRMPMWLAVVVAAVGLLLVTIPGVWVFVSVTAEPLYPNPGKVPTVMHSGPPPRWAGVVKHGRQIVRETMATQNLPGLSVAIGIHGDLVWAEGFGFADIETGVFGHTGSPVQDRDCFEGAHLGCSRPAAGEGPPEA
jgi:serine beta-lactamase-like protein LACTB, mitochondrial